MSARLPYLLPFEMGCSVLTFQPSAQFNILKSNSESAQDHIPKGEGWVSERGFLSVVGLEKLLTDDDKQMGSQWVSQ